MEIKNHPKDGAAVTTMTEDLRISMPASAAASGFARTLMERRLNKWGYSHVMDEALLVTAEMVTNAAQATPGKEITLLCRWEAKAVLVAVWDSSPQPPAPAPVIELTLDDLDLSESRFDANGGRGLHIVDALAIDWGYRPDPIDPRSGHSPGKWVWARLKAVPTGPAEHK
jgi:anti-sigma regulatory factor (Ser/Thr protein kinase)